MGAAKAPAPGKPPAPQGEQDELATYVGADIFPHGLPHGPARHSELFKKKTGHWESKRMLV